MAIGQTLQAGGAGPPVLGPGEPSGSWVGVGNDEFMVVSRDGKNWARYQFGGAGETAVYKPALNGSTLVHSSFDIVTRSWRLDNLTLPAWTQDDGTFSQAAVVMYGNGVYVGMTTNQLKTSSDGLTWVAQTNPPPPLGSTFGSFFTFLPSVGLFFVAGTQFSADYATSVNGITWTQRTFPTNWLGNFQNTIDWVVDDGTTNIVVGLSDGRIYQSTDAINWTLRATLGASLLNVVWNPVHGLFYVSMFLANPNNVYTSPDGITWTPLVGNNMDSIDTAGQWAVDPVTGLMYLSGGQSNSSSYATNDQGYSNDGITYFPVFPRGSRFILHHPEKIGPVIDETLKASPDPIVIISGVGSPARSFARFTSRADNTIDEQTTLGGIVQIGLWTAGLDYLNPSAREIMLTQISGDTLNFGNPGLGVWLNCGSDRFWGYDVNPGPGVLNGVFEVKYRDALTLVEGDPVTVTITAEST